MRHIQPNRPYKPSTGLEGADIPVTECHNHPPQKGSGCLEEMADSWGGGGKVQERGWNTLLYQKVRSTQTMTWTCQKRHKGQLEGLSLGQFEHQNLK